MDAMAGAASALRWWQEAGVDVLVEDVPRNWLQPQIERAARNEPAPVGDLPTSLDALRRWLLDPATLPELGSSRLDAAGNPTAALMVIVEMPEAGDTSADRLIAGDGGRLLDRMLAAIGMSRDSIYLASICPARPSGGRPSAGAAELLARAARRHVALVRPRLLLLLGQGAARAFEIAWPSPEHGLRNVNHEGTNVATIATCHPCFLLRQPARKADAWRDLRALMKELHR